MSHISDEEGGPSHALPPLDGGHGPARRISRQRSAALVQAALLAAFEEAPPPMCPARRKWHWGMWVGGAVLVLGAAAFLGWLALRGESALRAGATPAPRTSVDAPAPPGVPRGDAADDGRGPPAVDAEVRPDSRPVESSPPAEPTSTSSASVVAPSRAAGNVAPVPAEPPLPAEPTSASSTSVVAPARAPGNIASVPMKSPPPAQPASLAPARAPGNVAPVPVEDLLRAANTHRAAGEWKRAESLYQRVIRAQPRAMSAYVAHVASGSLRLEHLGDAGGALRQYEVALREWPEGLLAQEVRQGIAEAHRVLGNTAEERRALEAFLSHHGDAPHAVAARARLKEISGR
ncbi:hypothetical protein LY474_22580 [Myxococcus stipitatus]|uniref:tetratricopeptide repeat protein n=1 Tax=Myxococcus stipitatus TaxID=83455 RepID=UPI001F2E2868|nr:hypothetical protein [Myxococcus stipitatus]MCE9670596.1 hypothetical protein [Myxococcus stipitatus]